MTLFLSDTQAAHTGFVPVIYTEARNNMQPEVTLLGTIHFPTDSLGLEPCSRPGKALLSQCMLALVTASHAPPLRGPAGSRWKVLGVLKTALPLSSENGSPAGGGMLSAQVDLSFLKLWVCICQQIVT